jgi:uncharacterized protein (DUF885 family)
VHGVGLSEVARIEARYRAEVLAPLGYGTGPDDFKRFVDMARENEEYYVKTPEELVDIYRRLCAEISELMPQYFADIPKTPLEITTKNVGPAAYYLAGTPDGKRPGRFYVNVSHIEQRPLYETAALALHEAIPGHHHQVSLATENSGIPPFLRYIEDRRYEACPCRRNIYTGYAEGWVSTDTTDTTTTTTTTTTTAITITTTTRTTTITTTTRTTITTMLCSRALPAEVF